MIEFIHAYMTGLQIVVGILAVAAAVIVFVTTYKLD